MSGRSALLLALVAACGRPPEARPASAEASAPVPAPEPDAGAVDASPPVAQAAAAWPELVRDEEWDAAWRATGALAPADLARPEIRFVRARVALERGDAAAALPLLEGLEAGLPLLASDIGARRAEASLAVGPFADAAAWFSARPSPASQLDAARAFEKAGDARHALSAVDKVLAADKRTRRQEGEARALRVRLAPSPGDVERGDLRWLAVRGADLEAAASAPAQLAKADPGKPLLAGELLARATALADGGHVDDALRALDQSGVAPDAGSVTNLARARQRGMILYHARGRWLEAAKVLTECAGTRAPTAAEDAFHAARALSRADHDDEAIRGYEDVARRFPKTSWATQAAFFVPYLQLLHGEWTDCARGFDAYLKAHADGEQAGDARRDGALCKLEAGQTKAARAAFERLVDDEKDPGASARMEDMAGLAALADGDRTHAVARWTDVATRRPLTWPALVARARLAEAGAPVPPSFEPAPSAPAPPALSPVVPAPADLLHALGLDADAELAIRERESLVTAGAGARATEALCASYGALSRARRRYQVSQSVPGALLAAAPGPATAWAWRCAFPGPYEHEVHAAEAAEGLPAGLLWAIMRQESAYDPDAVSPAHAVGLMQLLPETARPVAAELGLGQEDARLTSPRYALAVAARYLHHLLERFHGRVPLAVAAYNCGAESVDRWLSRSPGLEMDGFVERIPFKETRDYVARVMGNLARYAYLEGGEGGERPLELKLRP